MSAALHQRVRRRGLGTRVANRKVHRKARLSSLFDDLEAEFANTRRLLERFPDLALLPGARRRTTRILRGYAALPARLGG